MDGLMLVLRALIGFHASLGLQILVWVSLWMVGLWALRVRAGALQHAAWVIVLGTIPLFPLAGGQILRVPPVREAISAFSTPLPQIASVWDARFIFSAERPDTGAEKAIPWTGTGRTSVDVSVEEPSSRRKGFELGAVASLVRRHVRSIGLTVLGSVWLAGMLGMLGRTILGYLDLLRVRARAREVRDPRLLAMLGGLRTKMGIRRAVVLGESLDLSSPISYGLRRPTILLPASMGDSVPLRAMHPHTIRAMMIHELAHIRRWDVWVILGQRILEAFFFYHPLIWLASRKLDLNREHACDDWVLHLGSDRKQYAMSLLTAMQSEAHIGPRLVNALFGRPGRLTRRIALIMETGRKVTPLVSRRALAIVVLISAVGALWIGSLPYVSHSEPRIGTLAEATHLLEQSRRIGERVPLKGTPWLREQALQSGKAVIHGEKLVTERATEIIRTERGIAKPQGLPFSERRMHTEQYEEGSAWLAYMHTVTLQDRPDGNLNKVNGLDGAARWVRSRIEPPLPKPARAQVPSRTIKAEHRPQRLPWDTEPPYVVAHLRIAQWTDHARFAARSGECVRVLVGPNKAGVTAIQVTPVSREEAVSFKFEAIGQDETVAASWALEDVKWGSSRDGGTASELNREYVIRADVTPNASRDRKITVHFRALFAMPPTGEEMAQWQARDGKEELAIDDMRSMARPFLSYAHTFNTLPRSPEAVGVEMLPDVYGTGGDLYRCELYGNGVLFYSCGEDGEYETDDDVVRTLTYTDHRWALQ